MALPRLRALPAPDRPAAATTTDVVTQALRSIGLEPVGTRPGRGGEPDAWNAVSVEGVRFRAEVLDPARAPAGPATTDHVGRVRHRAQALAELPPLTHLARTTVPVDLSRGRVLVASEDVGGPDLDVLLERGEPWRPGQVVTVLGAVARALALLHGSGMAHGRVRARHVALRRDGGPVLMGVVPGPARVGMPGDGGAQAQDVRDLLRLGRELLDRCPQRSVPPTHPLVGVLGRVEEGVPRACELVDALAALGPGEQVAVPEHALLAGQSLRDATARTRTTGRGRRRGRHRRPSRAGRAVPAVVAAVLALGGVGAAAHHLTTGAVAVEDPVDAALRLTRTRAEALAAGDRDLLRSVTVPGSPAAAADLVAATRTADVRPASLEVDLRAARVLGAEGTDVKTDGDTRAGGSAGTGAGRGAGAESGTVRVLVTSRIGAQVPATRGARDDTAGAGARVRSVVLVLRFVEGSWRVEDVEPAAGPASG